MNISIELDISETEYAELEKAVDDLDMIDVSEFFTACASVLINDTDSNLEVAIWVEMMKKLVSNVREGRRIFYEIVEDYAGDELAEYGAGYVQNMKLHKLSRIFTERTGVKISDYVLRNWVKKYYWANYPQLTEQYLFKIANSGGSE